MEIVGYFVVGDEVLKVIAQESRIGKNFLLRDSGEKGIRFEKEELNLKCNIGKLMRLRNGEKVYL